MTQEQNRKTYRSFQCRDYLWEIFERMSHELECSVDYLINEAMRQYARSRNYTTRPPIHRSGPPSAAPHPGMPPSSMGAPELPRSIPSIGVPGRPSSPPHPSRPPSAPYGAHAHGVQHPGAQHPGSHHPGAQHPGAPHPGSRHPSSPPGSTFPPPHGGVMPGAPAPLSTTTPPPLPRAGRSRPPLGGPRPTLSVIFNGQKIPIVKDEFVVGRGSKTADLPIKDNNISRRHAAVVFEHSAYYIKDLGSTNGIEFGGHRIDSRRIDEGDVYQICDYELRFTYR